MFTILDMNMDIVITLVKFIYIVALSVFSLSKDLKTQNLILIFNCKLTIVLSNNIIHIYRSLCIIYYRD